MASAFEQVLTGLRSALGRTLPVHANASLTPLADTGLAHWHVRIGSSGLLVRIPKQSQTQLAADDNIAYQRACFERAGASGYTPRVHHVLAPSGDLPRGALLVDEIVGRAARLPADLPALMTALAAIHSLIVPETSQRLPLRDAADPLADLLHEVTGQAAHLGGARLEAPVRTIIDAEIARFAALVAEHARPPKALIAFDAHPGNFIVAPAGRAMLVDLEKARYAYPPLDLAHATLYTSTTWDVGSIAVLSVEDIAAGYAAWASVFGPNARDHEPWFVPLRRAMWLWSVTWSAKWRVLSVGSAAAVADGEDWSASNSETALIAHVRDRVDHYLSTEIFSRMRDEFIELDRLFGTDVSQSRSSV